MNKLFMITCVILSTLILSGCGTNTDDANVQTQTKPTDVVVTTDNKYKTTEPTQEIVFNDFTTYTMDQITTANTEANCLTVIDDKVYDLTAWINQHPGGDRNILRICGIDGTSAFHGKHGGQQSPEATLEGFQVGLLTQ